MKSQKRNRKFSQRLVVAANKKAKTPEKKEKHLQELACYEAFFIGAHSIHVKDISFHMHCGDEFRDSKADQ
jgi:hypothetical protein